MSSVYCALEFGMLFPSKRCTSSRKASFQATHSSSQGKSDGTTALLLPAVVRFFSKSLPHLLPRQAFSFEPMPDGFQIPTFICSSRKYRLSANPCADDGVVLVQDNE